MNTYPSAELSPSDRRRLLSMFIESAPLSPELLADFHNEVLVEQKRGDIPAISLEIINQDTHKTSKVHVDLIFEEPSLDIPIGDEVVTTDFDELQFIQGLIFPTYD